jgi:sulfopyruvate decarboxylase TPP-binding subunit
MGVKHGKTPFFTVQTEGLGNMKNQVTDLGLNVLLLLRLRA